MWPAFWAELSCGLLPGGFPGEGRRPGAGGSPDRAGTCRTALAARNG